MNICLVNIPRCQIFICVCKVLCLFQGKGEKGKGNIIKRQKISALKHFLLPIYSKK